ncbi:MAG: hypothetical protein RBR28_00015 [Lentimicrobium sp.]|jgi:DNA-binding beta-propeller fold protein YncE|nr:hypothetical protein [Lentimicrobium sp.]
MKASLIMWLLLPCAALSAQQFIHPSAEKLWEVSGGMVTPESVLYDAASGVIYVANINENPWEKDGNGFISQLSTQGEIIKLKWATGLDAPKGMGLTDDYLFVTNIDEVVKIDKHSGEVIQRFTHPEAVNLNDIAVSEDKRIFISDSRGPCLFELTNELKVLIKSDDVKASNGLDVEGKLLLVGQRNRMAAIDLTTLKVSTFLNNTGSIDGLETVGDGTYLISDWAGKIQRVSPSQDAVILINTSADKINAADIDFNSADKILYVPTFFHNSVTAFKLNF